jgi:hypothetical protein
MVRESFRVAEVTPIMFCWRAPPLSRLRMRVDGSRSTRLEQDQPASFDNLMPTGIDACLTQVNGLVKVQELRANSMEIHNIVLIRQEKVRQMKPISLARRRIGFPLQAPDSSARFPHLHIRTASEFKDWFVDSLQVGVHLTRKIGAARDCCNRIEISTA